MELSQSDDRFLVPDSEDEELNTCEAWDLILGLKALAAARRQLCLQQNREMDDQDKSTGNKKSIFPSIDSDDKDSESEVALVYETLSECGSGSSRERHNVTVIDRRNAAKEDGSKKKSGDGVSTPSEYIGSLQLSQQAMLVPETMESLDTGPSPNASLTGPFVVPDSPSQDQESSSDQKDKNNDMDDEVTFNPRLLSTLASQSVDNGQGESQCLHLRLSPSQPDSMHDSGNPDQIDQHPTSTSKSEPLSKTPIKNPQISLSCRKLSLKDSSPSKQPANPVPTSSLERTSVEGPMFLDKDDFESLQGRNEEDSDKADGGKPRSKDRSAQSLGLFLDTEEEEARKVASTNRLKGQSSKNSKETERKGEAQQQFSFREAKSLRRQKIEERLQKVISSRAKDDEEESKETSNIKGDKQQRFIDEASMVFTEEQNSETMEDEQTMSYEYYKNRSVDPDQDVDIIQPSLPRRDVRKMGEPLGQSQSQGEFHGFEKEDDETAIQVQGTDREGDQCSSLVQPMEVDKADDVNKYPETSKGPDVRSQGNARPGAEESSVGPPRRKDASMGMSESSALHDPYTFHGSQTQNMADVSAQPLSDKQKKTKRIKEMRKVLKKKAPTKKNVASSSTDDADPNKQSVRPLPTPSERKKHKKLKSPHTPLSTATGETVTNVTSGRLTGLMLPPIAESTVITSQGQSSQTSNAPKVSQSEVKLSRKGTTVSFSDEHKSKDGTLVQEASDHGQCERERKTIREVMAVVLTRETTTEVFDSKGKLLRQNTTSEVINKTVIQPPWPSTEVHVSERIIYPDTSPTRSASTLTSGDLADVSSSSLSRTLSSGSKGSNPSLEAVIPSYPTPAQRTRSMEQNIDPAGGIPSSLEDEYIPASVTKAMSVAPPGPVTLDAKRLSSGSNTGQDLFGTPNESLIARCDSSHTGAVVSSSHNTPVLVSISHNTPVLEPQVTSVSVKRTADGSNGRQGEITEPSTSVGNLSIGGPSRIKGKDHDVGKRSSRESPTAPGVMFSMESASVDKERQNKMEVETVVMAGKGKQRRGAPTSMKFKGKGKRVAEETDTVTEKGSSARKRPKSDQCVDVEGEGEGSEERVGSGVSTGFVVQGGATISQAIHGDAQAPLTPHPKSHEESADVSDKATCDIKSNLEIGEQVMGRWTDGCFYPGVLNKMDFNNQRFQVRFDDGTQKWVEAHGLLLAKELPVGQSVMVLSDDGYYVCGMIMKHSVAQPQKGGGKVKVVYHVERDDSVQQRCERKSLLLSEDQAACLLSVENLCVSEYLIRSPFKIGDVSLDNLVEGKRKPRPSKDKPSTSKDQENTSVAGDISNAEIKMDEAPAGGRRKQGPVATSTPTPKQVSRVQGTSTGSAGKHSKSNTLGGVVSSPMAPRKSSRVGQRLDFAKNQSSPKPNLFKGKAFLLTHIKKTEEQRAEEKKLLQDSSLDTSADDNAEEETEYLPFDKDELCALIKAGGGKVMDSYDEEEIETYGKSNCYVIASEHQRTIKYLQGLAAGLALVSFQWILHSEAQNRLLGIKAFLLPAGISLEKKRLMEWKGSCTQLVGQTMMVHSKRDDFVQVWNSILETAGCHLVSKFPPRASKIDPGVDFVVTDETCPAVVVRKCKSLEVPVVSSEWLAQCLINNRLVEPNAYKEYKHDFCSS